MGGGEIGLDGGHVALGHTAPCQRARYTVDAGGVRRGWVRRRETGEGII